MNEAVVRVAKQIVSFKVSLEQIWKEDVLNIATTIHGLKKKLKELDVLDGVALYCKCDPMKEGVIEKKVIVKVLEHQIHDLKNWKQGITLQKKWLFLHQIIFSTDQVGVKKKFILFKNRNSMMYDNLCFWINMTFPTKL